jgi:hypothetical protein
MIPQKKVESKSLKLLHPWEVLCTALYSLHLQYSCTDRERIWSLWWVIKKIDFSFSF